MLLSRSVRSSFAGCLFDRRAEPLPAGSGFGGTTEIQKEIIARNLGL
jgi:hypothetical protein